MRGCSECYTLFKSFGGIMRGLYIHIPFCLKKCKYCDFTSFVGCEEHFAEYIKCVKKEMAEYKGEKIDTIFIGGGTPSILSKELLGELIKSIYDTFNIDKNVEFTIESNPKTLTFEKLELLKELGVNRLSIGVQSFIDGELKKIGRIHSSNDASEAVNLAKKAGFKNINLDLMFSIPEQTIDTFKKSIDIAISLNPEHISAYSLILEEGTPLFFEVEKGEALLPNDETDRENYQYLCEKLEAEGYMQYEISNFSKKGYECRHNIKYWDCDEYIGIGISAHSYFDGRRYYNTDSLENYLNCEYRKDLGEILSPDEKIKEYVIMGFRKTEGISKKAFFEKFSVDFYEKFRVQIDKFKNLNLIEEKGDFYRLTFEGINLSNSVLCEFL